MDSLRMLVQTVIKGLKILTKEAEKFEEHLMKLEKSKEPYISKPVKERKRRGRPAKTGKSSATSTVLDIITRSRKGVSTAKIKELTGFDEKKIWNIINRLKKEGKVKSLKRGIYGKA